MPRLKKYATNTILTLAAIILATEAVGFFSLQVNLKLYNTAAASLSALFKKKNMREKFTAYVKGPFSPVTGWQHSSWTGKYSWDCAGRQLRFTHDQYGARIYGGYQPEAVQVMMIGDSFTWGYGVGDNESVAAQLFQQTGIVSANLGVAMYDPVQSLLLATSHIKHFPNTRVVVMGIMYENIYRMVNSYRYAYLPGPEVLFMQKPFMKNGKLHTLDAGNFRSIEAFSASAVAATQEDYWGKPIHRFPYSVALVKALLAPNIQHLSPWEEWYGYRYEYERAYRNRMLGDNLFALVTMFAQWAEKERVKPMVLFLPANRNDTISPQYWIDAYANRLPDTLIIRNVNARQMDLQNYKLRGGCHPTRTGARDLARQYARMIEEHAFLLRPFLYKSVYANMETAHRKKEAP